MVTLVGVWMKGREKGSSGVLIVKCFLTLTAVPEVHPLEKETFLRNTVEVKHLHTLTLVKGLCIMVVL